MRIIALCLEGCGPHDIMRMGHLLTARAFGRDAHNESSV